MKYCNQKLTEAEKKVELLVKDKEGKLQFRALDAVTTEDSDEDERLTTIVNFREITVFKGCRCALSFLPAAIRLITPPHPVLAF